jgi:uncharacterized protein (TIGR01777 family)
VPEYASQLELPHAASFVFAWLERPGALTRLTPPWEGTKVVAQTGTVHDGDTVTIKIKRPPTTLVMVHEGYVPGVRFTDSMEKGPFKRWAHTHEVEPLGPDRCVLHDKIDYDVFARPIGKGIVEGRLAKMFRYRSVVVPNDLAEHARYASRPRLRVAVSGASGTIGGPLCAFLTTGGHTVLRLVRREAKRDDEIQWDPEAAKIDEVRLAGCDAIVHLAGENVGGGRWNDARKKRILDSRVQGTDLLARAVAKLGIKTFVSASGVGYYGADVEGQVDETGALGHDFLAEVVHSWEGAAEPARQAGARVVHPRIGVVLTPEGGALAEMAGPFSWGVGGPIGGGKQGFSWVAMDDVLYAIHRMLFDDKLVGPINVCAPEPVSQKVFAKTLGHVLGRPAFMPLPGFAVKGLLGELGKVVLLGGQYVVPARLTQCGFAFSQPSLEGHLRHVLGRTN